MFPSQLTISGGFIDDIATAVRYRALVWARLRHIIKLDILTVYSKVAFENRDSHYQRATDLIPPFNRYRLSRMSDRVDEH